MDKDAASVDDEGYTVVYSVFVMTTGVSDVEFVTSGAVVGRTLFTGERIELDGTGAG